MHTLTFQNSQEARRPTLHAVCSTVFCGNGYKCQYNRFGNGWKCQDNRLSGNPSHQSAGTVERLTGLSHWRSYKTVKLEERRLCPCGYHSSSLINSTHRVESWCLAETGDLLCEGAKQQSAVTFAGPKGRGSQCRRYSWWRVEVQCVVHTSSC